MKRFVLAALAIMTIVPGLFAQSIYCPPKKDQLYIEVSALGNLDYFYDHKMGLEMAGKELGVRTQYVGPAEYDMNAMVSAFEEAIAKKPNGIIVVGFESTLNAIVDKAVNMGIPVVTVDADLPGSKRMAFVGTGNYNAGMVGGTKLASLIGGKGKVAIITKPGQSNLEERISGYKAALAKYPGIKIVQIADDQSDPVQAAQVTAALLQRFPDLAGIACVEGAGGEGVPTAVREAGKVGKVKIVSMDRSNDILQAIKEGVISASIAQQTALMPYYALQILYNYNNSKVAITSDNKAAGVPGIPVTIDTGVVVIDSSNYQYFKR
ncbi:MAG: substrate-binding domain-containing protein [Treponema sp.]|nr:substrate-binding domain-containing protein [Treponema sp.]